MKVHIVPHSHWDREWYFNIEDSNLLLGENMTHLMGVLEKREDYSSYSFDAQASILDEYIKVYPENRERLKKLIEDKRIFVGPWYTQTDSLLVNKESIIRNLQYGIDICEEFGYSTPVGYLPDIFGQNQYLPSIFKGFEIESAIFQRGVYTDQLKGNLNFNWVSPDGNKIDTNNIYLGYGPGKFLEAGEEYVNEKLLPMLEKLKNLNKDCDVLLLPAGGDQVLIREHFPEVIEELNKKNLGYEFVLSNYEDFMKEAWDGKNYKNTIEGELRGCEKSRIHRTIGSQRYDIKVANSRVENKILKVLEPLSVMGMDLGIEYPQRWLDVCWKLLFDVHAHDSIGGCNSDSTNAEIVNRIDKVEKIVDGLINIAKKKIVTGIAKTLKKEDIITLFNTHPKTKKSETKVVTFTRGNAPVIKNLDGTTVESEIVSSEYISGGKVVIVTAQGEREEEVPGYHRAEIKVRDVLIPSMGYKTFIVEDDSRELDLSKTVTPEIENDYYKILVEKETLFLINKSTGERVEEFLGFESCLDGGDSYDFSPVKDDEKKYFNNFSVVSTYKGGGFERIELVSISKEPRQLEVATTLELVRGSEIIKVEQKIDNQEENHRLRCVINSGMKKQKLSYSDSGFSLVEHTTEEQRLEMWRENKYAEAPVPIYNLENMVILKDEEKKLEFIGEGIKEYEVVDTKLAVTLFRAVGVLGNDNLMWRPGRASGINNKVVYTPDAQMKEEQTFTYALVVGEATGTAQSYRNMENYLQKDISYHLQNLNTFEERVERFEIPKVLEETPAEKTGFEIRNKSVFISVVKRSHRGASKIVRVFNPTEKNEVVSFEGEVTEVNLKENFLGKGREFVLRPGGYKTFKI